jgi:stearoyl-CoA desaturase (delta-9 desaturase)
VNKFLKDPNYLLKYSVIHCLLFTIACIFLSATVGIDLSFSVTLEDAWMPVLALLLCGLPSSVLHNCAHRNVGPRLVNDIVGEFLGTVMLYGYRGFSLGHMFHHKYPDNPEFDPHPPRGYSFLRFVISPVKATLIIIERAYFKEFGKNDSTKVNITKQKIYFNVSIFLKVMFWFLVFGLKGFVLFYLVLYVSNIFVFAHINYATHIEDEFGQSEIINLNNNLYYKFVNVVSFGGYFHKNHHQRPRVFNPSKVQATDIALKTYMPPESLKTKKRKKLFDLSLTNGLVNITKSLNLE